VKLVSGEIDERSRVRFVRECVVAVQFAHPNVVTVHDAGDDNGTLYLVMELVEGPTLAEVAARRGTLDPGEAVDIADQVLAAVDTGHRAGFVHCDIKPANILLRRSFESFGGLHSGSGWIVKLTDFGAARRADEPVTRGDEVLMTPPYMSPEQAAGRSVTPASDLYTVGVVLFEVLSGGVPFVRDTPLATAMAHREAPVPSLLARRPDLAPSLASVVERALEKAPEARDAGAATMRSALAAALRGG
jgi:eukaryotic-like serine/threonine-protein kinase